MADGSEPAAAEGRPVEFARRGGVVLRADAWGSPQAPAVLLLHGGGQTRNSWAGTGRRLGAAGWRAISLDMRGHGESDWAPDGNYSLDAFVADLRAVAESFAQPPALVGASLGGLTAALAAGEGDSPVASALVLVDIAPRLEPEGVKRIIDFMQASPEGFASLEEAADAVAAYRRHRSRPRDVSGLEKNLRRGEDGRYRWHWDPQFMAAGRGPAALRMQERFGRALRTLRIPTLMVRGRESDVVSEAGAAELLAAVPHARFAAVSQAGHMVAGDRNDAFTEVVVELLREVAPARTPPA